MNDTQHQSDEVLVRILLGLHAGPVLNISEATDALLAWRDSRVATAREEAETNGRIKELHFLRTHCDPMILDTVYIDRRLATLSPKSGDVGVKQ